MATSTLPQDQSREGNGGGTKAPAAAVTDLVIEIVPHDYVIWSGTAAQLAAERIVPAGFNWAVSDRHEWEASGFNYRLSRRRPKGVTTQEWRGSDRDHWVMFRSGRGSSFLAGRLHAARQQVADLERLESAAATVQGIRLGAAREDRAFQGFMSAIRPNV